MSETPPRIPAEAFHPSEFIIEEMTARDWDIRELARRMGGDLERNIAALDLYFGIGPTEPTLRIGEEAAQVLARAFDVSSDYFQNLERAWVDWIAARTPTGGADG